ncbi:hypothetical protein HDV00_003529 [Rhizophlyctis rosea]|nr:hypothetical protein HDV00_003529 [Rhizophlyctis rosea]
MTTIFQRHIIPILRASATSGSLYTVGDVINQTVIEPHSQTAHTTDPPPKPTTSALERVDWTRTGKFALTGALLHGPYFLYAFRFLDHILGPSTTLLKAFKKACVGQFLVFPPFSAAFLSLIAILHNQSPLENIKQKYLEVFVNASIVWPIANVVTFGVVPIKWRIAWINVVGIGWNSYLSFVTGRGRVGEGTTPGSGDLELPYGK